MSQQVKHFNNGFIEVACKRTDSGDFVTLAMSPRADDYHRYVTGRMGAATDTEWVWGRYFQTIEAAVTDYSER